MVASLLSALVSPPSGLYLVHEVTKLPLQVVQKLFRRYEPSSIPIHLALVFIPPTLIGVASTSTYTLASLALSVSLNICVYLASLGLFTIIYRLSPVHPLARYPGPTLAKISKGWYALLSVPGHAHEAVQALHERYGDVVRIGASSYSYAHF